MMVFGLVPLFFLLCLGAVMLWALSKLFGRRRLRVVLGVLIVIAGLSLLAAIVRPSVRRDGVQPRVPFYPAQFNRPPSSARDPKFVDEMEQIDSYYSSERHSSAPIKPPAGWSQAMDRLFATASVFPSADSAARAMGWRIADWAADRRDPADEYEPVTVTLGGLADRALLEVVADTLRTQIDNSTVRIRDAATNQSTSMPTGHRVDVEIVHINLHRGPLRTDRPGQKRDVSPIVAPPPTQRWALQASAVFAGNPFAGQPEFSCTLNYSDKGWVDQFDVFAMAAPHRQWVVAYSPDPDSSAQGAHTQAIDAAVASLETIVLPRLAQAPSLQPELVRQRLRRAIADGDVITERFSQSADQPYGKIWREAILIDVSKGQLDGLMAAVQADAARRVHVAAAHRAQWQRDSAAIAGLLLLICLVYVGANAVTKGYYTWRLRTVAVVLGVAGALYVLSLT